MQSILFYGLDTKEELEQQLVQLSKSGGQDKEDVECAPEKNSKAKRQLVEYSDGVSAKSMKRRKEHQLERKAKKLAEVKSINDIAKEVLEKQQKRPVSTYVQLEEKFMAAQEELKLTCRKLATSEAKITELNEELIDKKASLDVKKMMIEELQSRVAELELENKSLKVKCSHSLAGASLSTGIAYYKFVRHAYY